MMKKLLLGLAALIGSPAVADVSPPTPVVIDGKLAGANGVVFNNKAYNVTFSTGSCVQNFSGCDAASDLDFSTQLTAQQAAQALLDQVFVTLSGVNYGTDFGKVVGCSAFYGCASYVPYRLADGRVDTARASPSAPRREVQLASLELYEPPFSANYARFTLANAGAVPEPATWAMMIGGLGVIGASMRRRARATALA